MKFWDRFLKRFGVEKPNVESNLVIISGPNVFGIVAWLKREHSFTRDKSHPSKITSTHCALLLDTKARLFKLVSNHSVPSYTCRKLHVGEFEGPKLVENKSKLLASLRL